MNFFSVSSRSGQGKLNCFYFQNNTGNFYRQGQNHQNLLKKKRLLCARGWVSFFFYLQNFFPVARILTTGCLRKRKEWLRSGEDWSIWLHLFFCKSFSLRGEIPQHFGGKTFGLTGDALCLRALEEDGWSYFFYSEGEPLLPKAVTELKP